MKPHDTHAPGGGSTRLRLELATRDELLDVARLLSAVALGAIVHATGAALTPDQAADVVLSVDPATCLCPGDHMLANLLRREPMARGLAQKCDRLPCTGRPTGGAS